MTRRDWSFEWKEDRTGSLVGRIVGGVADDVRRGRLRSGDVLPGARTLAGQLKVSRNTVTAAYRELAAEGWVIAEPRGGTRVADDLPAAPRAFAPQPARMPERPAFALSREGLLPVPIAEAPRVPGALVLAGGVPDVRLVPVEALARAWRRAVRGPAGRRALSYGDPRGHPALRRAIAEMVRTTRGVPATEENVIVVRGSQMALDLAARAILAPGEAIGVEAIGYRPAWAAFARGGARVVPLPLDASGLDVAGLEVELGRRRDLRAVYVTPHHQYPTTVTLSASRRLALLALAARARLAIIEDDYDHELSYEGRPVLPLASADRHGVVAYVGTLAKVVAPGLRLGYLVAPAALVERLARDRFVEDRQGDHVTEAAVAELFEDGEVARHVRRMRRIYRARRDVLVAALEKHLGDRLAVDVPAGGMALWARVTDRRVSVAAWEARGRELGVVFTAGRRYTWRDEEIPFVRLGFAPLDERELREAAVRLAKAWPRR